MEIERPESSGKARMIPAVIKGNVMPSRIVWGRIIKADSVHLNEAMARDEPRFENTLA